MLIGSLGAALRVSADLNSDLDRQIDSKRNFEIACQDRALEANYGPGGEYRVQNNIVSVRDVGRCQQGVERWTQVAVLNTVMTDNCLRGKRHEQWTMRNGFLTNIVKGESCYYSDYSLGNEITAKEIYPIRWKCGRYTGYNPDGLTKYCTSEIVRSSNLLPSGGSGAGFIRKLFGI
jgi:hypothetical protein